MASAVKYLSNVTKSVKYAAIDALKDLNPIIVEGVEENADVAKVTYSSIKNFKTIIPKAAKSLADSQVGELARETKKNLIADLKSGKFYNRERASRIENDLASEYTDDDYKEFLADDGADDLGFDTESNEFLVDAMDEVGEKTSSAVGQVLARTAEYQVEATRQSTTRLLAQSAAAVATIHGDLAAVNANIAGVVRFNQEVMATHIENSRMFYERQQQQMSEQTALLTEIRDIQKAVFTPAKKGFNSKVKVSDIFTANGMINLAEYFKYVQQNIKEQDSGIGDWLQVFGELGLGRTIAANPLGEIMKGVIKTAIPKVLKDAMTEFNETLAGAVSTSLINITKQRDSSNGFMAMLGNIFGIDLSTKKSINTGAYEKGPTAWTGKDHKALTEVIPTLLGKIYSSVSGDREMRYDYESGKFKSFKEIKKDFKRTKDNYVRNANDSVLPYIQDELKKVNFKGDKKREQEFIDNLERILRYNFDNMEKFNPRDRSKSAKTYGLKGDHAEYDLKLIRAIYDKIPKSKQLKNQGDLIESIQSWNRTIQQLQESGDSSFNVLFDGSMGKKGKHPASSPIAIGFTKLDTTNSLLEEIRDYLYEDPKRRKRLRKQVKNTNTTQNIVTVNTAGKKKENKVKSAMGFDVSRSEDAKTTMDIDEDINFDDTGAEESKFIKDIRKAETATQKLKALFKGGSLILTKPAEFAVGILRKVDNRIYNLLFSKDEDDTDSIMGKIQEGFDDWFETLKETTKAKIDGIREAIDENDIKGKFSSIMKNLFGFDFGEWEGEFKEALFGDKDTSLVSGMKDLFRKGFREMFDGLRKFFKTETPEQEAARKGAKAASTISSAFGKVTGNTSPNAASGTRRVSKTGLVAVSEGEMIIPPDMNINNIKKRSAKEKKAIEEFEAVYGKIGSIENFAEGGTYDPTHMYNFLKEKAKEGWSKSKIRKFIDEHIDDDKLKEDLKKMADSETVQYAKNRAKKAADKAISFGSSMGEEAKAFANTARENAFIDELVTKISGKIQKTVPENGKDVVKDIMGNFKDYLPRIAAGGVTGAGLSLLLGLAGGPILGAAVGAGVGILSKSEKLQTWLFGNKLEDGTRDGEGRIPKDIVRNMNQYFPGMAKGAIAGGIASILPFVPGGPVAGILVGSAVGFAKANDDLNKKLFGDDGKLKKATTILKQKLPKMGLGAAVGFLTGPFGLTANLMLGAGIGFVSDTEKFKEIVFGNKGVDGKRYGGIVGFIKEALETPVDMIKQMAKDTLDWFKNDIAKPAKNIARPLLQQIQNIGTYIGDKIADSFDTHIVKPIGHRLNKWFIKPMERVFGGLFKGVTGFIKGIISSPLKLGQALFGRIEEHQLNTIGAASNMSSEERQRRRQERVDRTASFRERINKVVGKEVFDVTGARQRKSDKMMNSASAKFDRMLNSMNEEEFSQFINIQQSIDSRTGKRVSEKKLNRSFITRTGIDKLILAEQNAGRISDKDANDLRRCIKRGDWDSLVKKFKSAYAGDKVYGPLIIKEIEKRKAERDKLEADWKVSEAKYNELVEKYGIDNISSRRAKAQARSIYKERYGSATDIEQDIPEEAEQETGTAEVVNSVDTVAETIKEAHKNTLAVLNNIYTVMVHGKDAVLNNNDSEPEDIGTEESKETPKMGNTALATVQNTRVEDINITDIVSSAQAGDYSLASRLANGAITKASQLKSAARNLVNRIRRKNSSSKTIMTDHGPVLMRTDAQGNEIPDERDSETKETLAIRDEQQATQKGILSKISSLGDGIKNFFGFGQEEKEEGNGWLSKILKYALPALAGVAGIGLASKIAGKKIQVQKRDSKGNKMYDENGNPIMTETTIGDAVKDGASRMWLGDDLTGNTSGAWYHIKDFTRNTLIPTLGAGFDIIVDKIPDLIATGVKAIVTNAPDIIIAIGKGLGSGLWEILKGGLSKLPGIGGFFKDKNSGKEDIKSAEEIQGGKVTLTKGLSGGTTATGTTPSVTSSGSSSTIVTTMQAAFDKANGGPIGTSSSTAGTTTKTTATKTIASSSSSSNRSVASGTSSIVQSGGSTGNIDNTKDVKKSLAYKRASKVVQDKALAPLSEVWNNVIFEDGTTVAQLCNDDRTVIAEFEDNNGQAYSVTGADILLYPEVAAQVLGIDIYLTDEELNENSQYVREATNTNPGNWAAVKILATGGKYGKGAISSGIRMISKAGDVGEAIGRGTGKVLSKLPGGKKFGYLAKGAGKLTKISSRIASVPMRVMESGRKIVEDFSNARRVGYGAKKAAWFAGQNVRYRAGQKINKAQDAFNNALESRRLNRLNKVDNAKTGIGKAWQKVKNIVPDKLDDVAEKVGNTAFNAAGKATTIDSSDVKKATSGMKNAFSKLKSKGGRVGKAAEAAGKLSSKAQDVVSKLQRLLNKFLSDNKVIKQLKKVLKCGKAKKELAEGAMEKALKNFSETIMEKFTKGIAKSAARIVAKISTKLAAYIGSAGLIAAAFLVVDFISGMSKADAIMGVEKPTIAERFIAGLINAFAETFFITLVVDTKDLVQFCINLLEGLGMDFSDLRKRQEEAEKNCDAYNREHGTNYTVEEYLMSDHLSTKIKNALGKVWDTVKGAGKSIVNFFTGGDKDEDEKKIEEKEKQEQKTAKGAESNNTGSTAQVANATNNTTSADQLVYDDAGNVVGSGVNEDGTIDSMYIPQGNATATSENLTTQANVTGVNTSMQSTLGSGSIISQGNQTAIQQVRTEINASIPQMIKVLKSRLAAYFGLKPSEFNKTSNVGQTAYKDSSPTMFFNSITNMWKQASSRVGNMFTALPKAIGSAAKNASHFLAVAFGLADPNEKNISLDDATNETYLDRRAKVISETSAFSATLGATSVTGSNSADENTQANALSEKKINKSSSGLLSKVGDFVSKIFGFGGGSGSGITGDVNGLPDEDRSKVETFISQKYSKYANDSFTVKGDNKRQTISDAGCAPAVATMAINNLGTVQPLDMDTAIKHAIGYKRPNGGVTADYFIDEFNKQGLQAAYVAGNANNKEAIIMNQLRQGNPIILMGQDENNSTKKISPFGPKTHYVVATGLSPDGRTIYINDPEARSPRVPYSVNRIMKGTILGVAPISKSKAKNISSSADKKAKKILRQFGGTGKYGSDTIQYQVWTKLRTQLSETQSAAVMGNIQAESGFDPSIIEGGTGWGFGLCQWTNPNGGSTGRRANLEQYAASIGKDPSDIGVQCDFLLAELNPNGGCNGYATYQLMTTNYEGKSWNKDTFNTATDLETLTKAFCYCWERPNAQYAHIDVRLEAAKEYYQEFMGVPAADGSSGGSSTDVESNNPITKLLNAFTELGSAYGLNDDSSTSGSSGGTNSSGYLDGEVKGATVSDSTKAKQQQQLVLQMKSIENKNVYGQGNSAFPATRNVDEGGGDCSSTVQWAYKKVLGVDPGSWTGAQETDEDTYTVTTSLNDPSKLQLGDLLLKDDHVEMYAGVDDQGNHQMIGHGGGQHTLPDGTVTSKGPYTQKLGSTPPYRNVRRWVGFKEGGSGSGLSSYSPASKKAIAGSKNNNIYSRKWAVGGSGTGIVSRDSSSSSNYIVSTTTATATPANRGSSRMVPAKSNQSGDGMDKLIQIIIGLLSQVVNNTSAIKDISSLLIKLIDLKSSSSGMSDKEKKALGNEMGLMKALIAQSFENQSGSEDANLARLIKNVEAIAQQ